MHATYWQYVPSIKNGTQKQLIALLLNFYARKNLYFNLRIQTFISEFLISDLGCITIYQKTFYTEIMTYHHSVENSYISRFSTSSCRKNSFVILQVNAYLLTLLLGNLRTLNLSDEFVALFREENTTLPLSQNSYLISNQK